MSVAALAALFVTLAALAVVPGVSVLTVVARASAGGLAQGVLTALGVVTGDVLYILVALFGLTALAELAAPWLSVLRVMAALGLALFAWSLWCAPPPGAMKAGRADGWGSFAAGLAVTLADHKAIAFYLVLLPAFVDLPALGAGGMLAVLGVEVLAVFGAKMVWVLAAGQVAQRWRGQARWLQRAAALVLACVAMVMLAHALTR
jgi:threonine/homoserine/homoserine lactone efflux protein